ncbi:MAG: NAD(P)H nitroreductase [Thalassotalea sp.]
MLDSLSLLLTRQSTPQLCAPAPSNEDISTIIAAGMRVPDHAGLRPWHFTIIKEAGLNKLSEVFVNAIANTDANQAKLDKTAKMPFRAPLIIAVSTQYQHHDKVPEKEQLIAAGCACHAMQMACVALGYGAMWRTGELSYNDKVKSALSIKCTDDIVGFLYIGSHSKEQVNKTAKDSSEHVSFL